MTATKLKPIKFKKHKTIAGAARALLKLYEDERRHCTDTYFRGVSGRSVNDAKKAVSCCLSGGAGEFYDGEWEDISEVLERASAKLYGKGRSFVDVNDSEGLEAARKILRLVAKTV